MIQFLNENAAGLFEKSIEHFAISMISLGIGILIAVPIGLLLAKNKKLSNVVLTTAGVLQTVPTIALLALMIPLFGVVKTPAIIALSVYILLPILNNTVIGVQNIDADVKEAAKSMGMTDFQMLKTIDLPLALPLIMSGIRLASVYVMSWAALASYIGAGGLGDFVFNGLYRYESLASAEDCFSCSAGYGYCPECRRPAVHS